MSDRAATEGSKCFELGQHPHKLFNSKYLLLFETVVPHEPRAVVETPQICALT